MASNGILIVEHRPGCPGGEASCAPIFPEWGSSRRVFWESLAPERLGQLKDSLLIVNAVPATDRVVQFFRWLREHPVSIPVLAILPEHEAELLHTVAETVDDFLLWPYRPEELNKRITRLIGSRAEELCAVQASLAAEIGLEQLVGQDPAFLAALGQVALFGASDAPVLLTGETGTGKELCARVVHLLSKRHGGPFIPVDCGALPDHLFENEIFGHARGAFTDARSDQKGLVALAQRGTLFLDEIDSLSLAAQSKVLRLLQEHTYRPLGSEVFKQADVRIIAATNSDLETLVAQKRFRADLFFRINVLRVRLPALRERRSDVALLSRHFIEEICKGAHLPRKVLSAPAAQKLDQHDWPGNVRELYNIMQRAVLCSPGTQIGASAVELRACSSGKPPAGAIEGEDFRSAKQQAIQSFERQYVEQMMDKHEGNVTRAAREAGKDRRAFGRLAKKYQVPGASL